MAKKTNDSIALTVTLPASPAAVWQAWTDPRRLGWFGSDPAGTVIEATADARRGGSYRVTFENSNGSRYTAQGTYLIVEPQRRLEFTWTWAGIEHHTERVRVVFVAEGAGTSMSFEHLDIDPHTSHGYLEGWRTTFEKLDRQLRGSEPRPASPPEARASSAP
jgi:uncharacterized protein YndB with AHSA1/START domain